MSERVISKQAPSQRDWTKGNITGSLLSLSWPIVVHNALYMLGQTVDMIWIGRLGSAAVAGVGAAFVIHMLVLSAKMGLVTGARAMVARAIGRGDIDGANHISRQGFIVSIVYGVVFSLLGILLAENTLGLFGLKPEVARYGVQYMQMLFGGWLFYSLWLMAFSIMQAAGDTFTPMKIHAITRSIQLVLSPCLVFGWWFFPKMGVAGAALSMIIGQALGFVISFWILLSGRLRLKLTLRGFRLDTACITRMVKIGLPALIMGVQGNFGQTILMKFIAPFGTVAVASHTLNQRVEMFIQMPSIGLGTGAGVLVGQNLGARQPQRAEKTAWIATYLLAGFMAVCALAVVFSARYIIRIFSAEAEVVAMGATFLQIAAAGYLMSGVMSSMQNSISGSGDTLPPMVISLVSTWVILIPAAYLLPRWTNLEVLGIRWAFIISHTFSSVAYTLYFRTGRWKTKIL